MRDCCVYACVAYVCPAASGCNLVVWLDHLNRELVMRRFFT